MGSIINTTEPMADCRVLYIEDDIASCNLVKQAFKHHQELSLTIVNNLQDAREQLLTRPDIILLDLHLPDGSGFDFLSYLHAQAEFSQIPVIAVSASAMRDEVDKGLAAGVHRYLTKPLELSELFEAIDTLR